VKTPPKRMMLTGFWHPVQFSKNDPHPPDQPNENQPVGPDRTAGRCSRLTPMGPAQRDVGRGNPWTSDGGDTGLLSSRSNGRRDGTRRRDRVSTRCSAVRAGPGSKSVARGADPTASRRASRRLDPTVSRGGAHASERSPVPRTDGPGTRCPRTPPRRASEVDRRRTATGRGWPGGVAGTG
jgi:hypothetical protein